MNRTGPLKIDVVVLQPVPERYRVGLALAGKGVVEGMERGGWMISPKRAVGQGIEEWREGDGEKIILHICGG